MTVCFAATVARTGRINIQAMASDRACGPRRRIAPEESRRAARRMTAARDGARRWADLRGGRPPSYPDTAGICGAAAG